MKVKISRILLAILVIYATSWASLSFFVQNNIKKLLEKNPELGVSLSYENVSVSGFPLNFTIKISKPKFSMISEQNDKNILANLLRSMEKNDPRKSQYINSLLNSKEKASFKVSSSGDLYINLSFLYKINEINFSGETEYVLNTKDDKFKINSKGENDFKLALNLPLYKIKNINLKDVIFARFKCKKCSLNNGLNEQKIYSAEKSYLYLNADRLGEESSDIQIEYYQRDRKIGHEGLNFLRNFVDSKFFNQLINSNDLKPMFKYLNHFDNFTGSGKISYIGGTNSDEIAKGNLKFSLQFKSKSDTSSYYGKSDLLLEFSMRDNIVKYSNLNIKGGKYRFTEEFYQFLTTNLTSLLPNSFFDELRQSIYKLPIEKKAKQYYANNHTVFIPRIQDFKEIELDSEIEYSNKKNRKKIKISELEFKLPDYQLDLEGSYIKRINGETAFDFEAKIDKYSNLINLLFNYFRKIYSYGKMKKIEDLKNKDFFASDKFREMVGSYLEQYGNEAILKNDRLELEIEKSYDSNEVTINDKKVNLDQIIKPFLDAQIKFLMKKELKKQEGKIKEKLNEEINKILLKF